MRIRLAVFGLIFLSVNASFVLASPSSPAQSCGSGRHWVKAHFRKGYVRGDGKRFKPTQVRAHCSDNPPGFAFWNPKIKSGKPGNWPHAKEIFKQWTEEELERFLEALGYLPEEMQRQDIQGFYRAFKSAFENNPASGDRDGNFVIYDNAFGDGNNLAQVLAHEIAHRIFESLTPEEIESYRFPAGWINVGTRENPKYVLIRNKMVDSDSANSVEEDFSNNVEFYLFNPSKLQEVSPSAYNWITKHFGAKFKLGKGRP